MFEFVLLKQSRNDLSNVCFIINPTEKSRNTTEKHVFGGSKN